MIRSFAQRAVQTGRVMSFSRFGNVARLSTYYTEDHEYVKVSRRGRVRARAHVR